MSYCFFERLLFVINFKCYSLLPHPERLIKICAVFLVYLQESVALCFLYMAHFLELRAGYSL